MSKRYTESNKQNLSEYKRYFRKRNYGTRWPVMIWLGLLSCLLYVVLNGYAGTKEAILLPIIICSAIAIAVWWMFSISSMNDLIMATELQNLILATAARSSALFCLIVRDDGSTVYADTGFKQKFIRTKSHQCKRDLDLLIEDLGIELDLQQMLRDGTKLKMPANLANQAISIVVESLSISFGKVTTIKTEQSHNNFFIIKGVLDEAPSLKGFIEYIADQPIACYQTDENKKFSYVNEAFANLVGYGKDDLLTGNLKLQDIIIDAQPLDINEAPGKKFIRHKNMDSSLVVQARLEIIDHDSQTQTYHLVFDHLAEDTEAYINYFLHNSPIANLILNEAGVIEKTNVAFDCMFPELAPRSNFIDLIDETDQQEVSRLIKTIVPEAIYVSHNKKPIEVKLRSPKQLTTLLYLNRLSTTNDTGPKIVCHFVDTTEQKNLEMHFVHSQKMQAVGQLAGGIAHDFNNLLTAMMGFCDLLLIRHPAGDQSFADIMQIKQNTNRAANLVRQLLAFSRKQVLQPEIIDVTGVLAESSNLVRRLIGENIKLNMSHGRDLRLVKVDQGQLEQVIINLAVNARDAMVSGGVLTIQTSNIDIDAQHQLDSNFISPAEDEKIEFGEYVLIEVADTGSGIPPQVVSKIFEPFFSTKEVGAGTGLGLSTVYGIVKQTGGYIYLTTEEGIGTKFYIYLKSYGNEVQPTRKLVDVDNDLSDKLASSDLTGHGTILLVEDEAPVRIFATHALMNKGYNVLEADNGEAALNIISQRGKEIDLIVTDVIMPGMNGPTMIEEVCKQYPDIKVIFISGYAEDALVKEDEARFNFLAKPFSLKQLAIKVKEVMSKEPLS